MKSSAETFINEQCYPDLNEEAAIAHLSKAIQCDTTGYVDLSRVKDEEFAKLHRHMKESYPCIMAYGSFEEIGKSVLITLPGNDASLKPALFMSHQDVVPVVKGTENDWKYPPYSGAVEEGYIWGRGALDIKNMVFGILEAAEYILSHGKTFKRTVYLAFGEDEETLNTGAAHIAQTLQSRGVRLEYVLDEGGGDISSAACYGAPDVQVSGICLYEKGYADLKIDAFSKGGHSSNPYGGTSLAALAKAINAIVSAPLNAELPQCCIKALEVLKPVITEEPMRTYVQDIEANKELILNYFSSSKELYNQVQTTIAPTMIQGGSEAGNVMPQNMSAVINFRLAPQDTIDALMEHCRELVDPALKLSYIQANNASTPSNPDSYGYKKLVETLQFFYKDITFIPALSVGATDAHNYECICDCCLRYGPFLEESSIQHEGVHGTNERISIRVFMQGIRTLIKMMEETCL